MVLCVGDPQLAGCRFFSWLGEAQWIAGNFPYGGPSWSAVELYNCQNGPSVPSNKLPLVVVRSVRGYREFTLIPG